MNLLEQPPVPERELPADRHRAVRAMLVAQARAELSVAATPDATDSRTDARPHPGALVRRRLLVAAASVLAAGLLAVQLWPVPTDPIIEAWQPTPDPVADPVAASMAEQCEEIFAEGRPRRSDWPDQGWRPAVVERRGSLATVLLIQPELGYYNDCVFEGIDPAAGGDRPAYQGMGGGGSSYTPLVSGEPLRWQEPYGATAWPPRGVEIGRSYGQVAPEVDRVVVRLSNGTEVSASVADGWFYAWWPGRAYRVLWWWHVRTPVPVSVSAYDAAGELLAQEEPPPCTLPRPVGCEE